MRRFIAASIVALAGLSVGSASADAPEGCVATRASGPCEYVATVPGNIVGAGNWRVEVWWSGNCGSGPANWVRESAPDTNFPELEIGDLEVRPPFATWAGSIGVGACARATAGAAGAVAIGEVRP